MENVFKTDDYEFDKVVEDNRQLGEQFLRIANKQFYKEDQDMFGETYETTDRISNFNKTQIKAKTDPHSSNTQFNIKQSEDEVYVKGGQMVSGTPKPFNELIGNVINGVAQNCKKMLKPHVEFATGDNNQQFKRSIQEKLARKKEGVVYKVVTVDISQQDSIKDKAVYAFMKKFYMKFGVEEEVIDMLFSIVGEWMMKTLFLKTMVNDKYLSGQPDTLLNNSFHGLFEMLIHVDINEPLLIASKGDDLVIIAEEVELKKGKEYPEYLKVAEGPIGSFIGFLIDENNVYLDIVRIAAKLSAKSETDNGRHEELRLAVKDNIEFSENFCQHQEQIYANCAYYGLEEGDVQILFSQLRSYSLKATTELPVVNRLLKKGKYRTMTNTPEYGEVITIPFNFEGVW